METIYRLVSNRAIAHWKTTVEGAVEAGILAGVGAVVNDHKTMQVAFGIAAWRFLRGLFGRDVK